MVMSLSEGQTSHLYRTVQLKSAVTHTNSCLLSVFCPVTDQAAITLPFYQLKGKNGYISMICLLQFPHGLVEVKMW